MTTEPGMGVDSSGAPVIDPTANVIALVQAGLQRQDDLRERDTQHIKELMGLRADYDAQLREAESKRIDAIRAVDVGAVNRAVDVAATQAGTLAAQVQASAEALRTQVAATATQADIKLTTALEPIIKDIADLRRVQYEQVGQKTQVTESRNSNAAVYAALGMGITILLTLLTVAAFVLARAGG